MIQLLKNIFGIGPKVDFKELMQNGAQIIDVRTNGQTANFEVDTSTVL